MNKCGGCANFIPDGCLWGDRIRRGGCKIAPFKTDKWGQTIKVNRLVTNRACKKFIAKEFTQEKEDE